MTRLRDLYYCKICTNLVEIFQEGSPALVCCGQDMIRLEAQTEDKGREKHVPVVEETDSGVLVKVGSVDHPMEEKHHIKFIEIITAGNEILRAELKPGDRPQAEFPVKKDNITKAREFCNVHMLWKY